MTTRHSALTAQRVREYCDLRLGPVLPPDQVKSLCRYLTALLGRGEYPPYRGSSLDIRAVAESLDMEPSDLSAVRAMLKPIFDAVSREVAEQRLRPLKAPRVRRTHPNHGRKPRPIEEFPEPLNETWDEPGSFGDALRLCSGPTAQTGPLDERYGSWECRGARATE